MRVFVTGASGYVGSAALPKLIAAGHQVVGLARSDASAAAIRALGAEPLAGELTDLDALTRGARESDGVIHLGFNHDFSKFAENGRVDKAAITAMGEVLEGTGKPLVVTSGTGFLTFDGSTATEDVQRAADEPSPRLSEQAVLAFLNRGVKAMAVRLPQVHGRGDHGFTPMLINIAREHGYAAYVGEGASRWSAVARDDAAKAFQLAFDKGQAGRTYHAVAEEGIPQRVIADAIGRGLGVPVRSIAPEEAEGYYGWFARFAMMDSPVSSAITRAELGWEPTGPGLIEDLETQDYFDAK